MLQSQIYVYFAFCHKFCSTYCTYFIMFVFKLLQLLVVRYFYDTAEQIYLFKYTLMKNFVLNFAQFPRQHDVAVQQECSSTNFLACYWTDVKKLCRSIGQKWVQSHPCSAVASIKYKLYPGEHEPHLQMLCHNFNFIFLTVRTPPADLRLYRNRSYNRKFRSHTFDDLLQWL